MTAQRRTRWVLVAALLCGGAGAATASDATFSLPDGFGTQKKDVGGGSPDSASAPDVGGIEGDAAAPESSDDAGGGDGGCRTTSPASRGPTSSPSPLTWAAAICIGASALTRRRTNQ